MTGHEAGRYRGGGTAAFEVLWKGLVWPNPAEFESEPLIFSPRTRECSVLCCFALVWPSEKKKKERWMDGWILWKDGCFIDRLINS